MKAMLFIHKVIRQISIRTNFTEEMHYRKTASKYDINGYKRIYLVHIRKTGGTSLNNMFLALSGEDSESLYNKLVNAKNHRLISNGFIYTGWNIRNINKGNYFYAFSHIPYHKLHLPKNTFTIVCFRDPAERVISHYNMLMEYKRNNINHPNMKEEEKWLGENFNDFLQLIPKEHLLNQLFMFSDNFDINEAAMNVKKLSHYFFGDTFNEGIIELSRKTGLHLEPIHIRKTRYNADISETNLIRLKDMLKDEYEFLDRVRQQANS